jgi:hypothetical protein
VVPISLDKITHVGQLSREGFIVSIPDVSIVPVLVECKHPETVHKV